MRDIHIEDLESIIQSRQRQPVILPFLLIGIRTSIRYLRRKENSQDPGTISS